MDDVKIGEILLPGDEAEQERQSQRVKKRFWPVLKRAMRQVPFSRDLVASYYCALDPRTPTKVRGILLAALASSCCRSTASPTSLLLSVSRTISRF